MFTSIKKTWELIIVLLALAGISFIAWYGYRTFIQPEGFVINTSGTAVVKEIQKLNRLETASYTLEKIIDASTQNNNKVQELLFGDRILLIANGTIIAGIDFSTVKPENIQVNGTSINVSLPAPILLVSKLNNEQTRVYDRRQGLLSKGETNLEADARAEAEKSLTMAACEAGIMQTAADNAQKQIMALLHSLGFTQVAVSIAKGSCP